MSLSETANGRADGAQPSVGLSASEAQIAPFDGYDLNDVPLGDLLRGERATLGKSLLDVERELRIRAAYIAAIENGDTGAFQSPGFIAGYVRSYARYLGIDPEWTFRRFCSETGFRGVHATATAPVASRSAPGSVTQSLPRRMDPNQVMAASRFSFAPERAGLLPALQPGALGSFAVLALVVLGIGYGAFAILHDIQRLQIAPIDEAPAAPLAQLDPLSGFTTAAEDFAQSPALALPRAGSGDGLYRPQALEAPILTPRDSALATLNPDEVGTLATASSGAAPSPEASSAGVQVTQTSDQVMIFATRPTWVLISTPTGDTIYEATLNAGDSYLVPEQGEAPILRSGNAGSLYFAVNGIAIGPAGTGAQIVRDVQLTADAVSERFPLADTEADPALVEVASLVFDGSSIPAGAVTVPDPQADQIVQATGVGARPQTVFRTPGPDDQRPVPRP